MVKLKSIEDLQSLPKTKWNILQPADDDIREDALETGNLLSPYCVTICFQNNLYICIGGLDLIIVPGLGFTINGKRLGRGKGYYDQCMMNYINKYPSNKLITIGLAFSQQICDDIPTNQQDCPIDIVIYP